MTSDGYKRERNKRQSRQHNSRLIYSPRKACFWIISALEASKWFQITYLTNVLTSISERFGPNFEQIKHFTMSAITLTYIQPN